MKTKVTLALEYYINIRVGKEQQSVEKDWV